MRRIVVLAHNLAVDSRVVRYATRIAKASRAEVNCLALITSYASTAELIHSQPEEVMGQLQGLRARQTTREWVHTLENLRSRQWREAERQKKELKDHFEREGVSFSCQVLTFDATSLDRALRALAPVSLLMSSRLRFPRDMTAQGIMTLGDLGARFRCPAIDVEIMQRFLDPRPWQLKVQLALYGGGSVAAGAWIWRHAEDLNGFLRSGGVAPAVVIMVAAALIAWGYGRAVQCLLRATKLDIY